MHPTIAKGVANCLATIAQATVHIALLDERGKNEAQIGERYFVRAELKREIDRATGAIAEWLTHPGVLS